MGKQSAPRWVAASLKENLKITASIAPARLRTAARIYRAELRRLGFTPVEIRILEVLSPHAAIAASADSFYAVARAAGRELAAIDFSRKRLERALNAYGAALGVLAPDRSDATLRQGIESICLIAVLAATEGYEDAQEQESALLDNLFRTGAASTGVQTVLNAFLAEITAYFAATDARLCEIDIEDGSVPTHRPSRPVGHPLLETTHIPGSAARNPRKSLLIEQDWPESVVDFWSAPLTRTNHRLWILQMAFSEKRPLLERDRRMLQAIALRCVSAVGWLAAQQDIRERSLRILKAEELERRRISRELHDEPAQLLAVVRLQLEMIEPALPESVRGDVLEIREQVERIILDVRRLISDLSPVILQQLGFEAAIRQLVTRVKRSGDARITIHLGALPQVGHQFALVVYRSLQECFTNISRHSLASHINVSITTADRVLRLQVQDDGIGFHVKEALSREECFGLVGMRERIALLGGRLSILSTPQCGDKKRRQSRSGTVICIELPIPEKNPS